MAPAAPAWVEIVTSLQEMEAIVTECRGGMKVPVGSYILMGSYEVYEMSEMTSAIADLKTFAVKCPRTEEGKILMLKMASLDAHIVNTMSKVDSLPAIADHDNLYLDLEAAKTKAKLQDLLAKKKEKEILRKARQSRMRVFKAKAKAYKELRAMAQKGSRRFKIGGEIQTKLIEFHLEVIGLVAYVLSCDCSIDLIIQELSRFNEDVLPKMRFSSAVLPDPVP